MVGPVATRPHPRRSVNFTDLMAPKPVKRCAPPSDVATLFAMDMRLPVDPQTQARQLAQLAAITQGTHVYVHTDDDARSRRAVQKLANVVAAGFGIANLSHNHNALQWWRLARCWELVRAFERKCGLQYAFAFKARTDMTIIPGKDGALLRTYHMRMQRVLRVHGHRPSAWIWGDRVIGATPAVMQLITHLDTDPFFDDLWLLCGPCDAVRKGLATAGKPASEARRMVLDLDLRAVVMAVASQPQDQPRHMASASCQASPPSAANGTADAPRAIQRAHLPHALVRALWGGKGSASRDTHAATKRMLRAQLSLPAGQLGESGAQPVCALSSSLCWKGRPAGKDAEEESPFASEVGLVVLLLNAGVSIRGLRDESVGVVSPQGLGLETWRKRLPSSTANLGLACTWPGAGRLPQMRLAPSRVIWQRRARDGWPATSRLRHIWWLHVPKAGTSFSQTVFHWACDHGKYKGTIGWNIAKGTHHPPRAACGSNISTEQRLDKSAQQQRQVKNSSRTPMVNDINYHQPLSEAARRQPNSVVALFRRPAQRLLSAFYWMKQKPWCCSLDWGFTPKHRAEVNDMATAAEMARQPWALGCQTKLLLGERCFSPGSAAKRPSALARALSFINGSSRGGGMRFVGLQEHWERSVCLWHARFGGPLYAAELSNTRPTNGASSAGYDERELGGVFDPKDEAVYAMAAARFWREVAEFSAPVEACMEAVARDAERQKAHSGGVMSHRAMLSHLLEHEGSQDRHRHTVAPPKGAHGGAAPLMQMNGEIAVAAEPAVTKAKAKAKAKAGGRHGRARRDERQIRQPPPSPVLQHHLCQDLQGRKLHHRRNRATHRP